MQDKYLPIGTVCTVKGNTNKIMIVGYLPVDYNGNLNVYDYRGCVYPNGLFASSNSISFNHQDIEKIDYIGYVSELHSNLNTNLLNASVVDTIKEKSKGTSNNRYVFDKNGVIIMDNSTNEVEKKTENKEVNNPFAMEYKEEISNENSNRFKFDENGIIIEDNSVSNKVESKSPYVFDENGFIIEDNTNKTEVNENKENNEDNNSNYEFDENGVIISDNTSKEVKVESKYKFDENGVIIAEN